MGRGQGGGIKQGQLPSALSLEPRALGETSCHVVKTLKWLHGGPHDKKLRPVGLEVTLPVTVRLQIPQSRLTF